MFSALDRIVSALRAICSITRTKVSTVSLKDLRKGSYWGSNGVSILCVRSPPATDCKAMARRCTTRSCASSMRARASLPSAASASCACRSDRLRAIRADLVAAVGEGHVGVVASASEGHDFLGQHRDGTATRACAGAVPRRKAGPRAPWPISARLVISCHWAAARLGPGVHAMATAPTAAAVSEPAKLGTARRNPSDETWASPDAIAARARLSNSDMSTPEALPRSTSVSPWATPRLRAGPCPHSFQAHGRGPPRSRRRCRSAGPRRWPQRRRTSWRPPVRGVRSRLHHWWCGCSEATGRWRPGSSPRP
jgi:hypothetical protein